MIIENENGIKEETAKGEISAQIAKFKKRNWNMKVKTQILAISHLFYERYNKLFSWMKKKIQFLQLINQHDVLQ